MSEKTSSAAGGGIGFIGLLQLAFIILKLCNVITWSWGLVLLPIFISVGLFVLGLIVLLILLISDK